MGHGLHKYEVCDDGTAISGKQCIEAEAERLRLLSWPLETEPGFTALVNRSLAMFFNDKQARLRYCRKRAVHYVVLPQYWRDDEAFYAALALLMRLHATMRHDEFVGRFVHRNAATSDADTLWRDYSLVVYVAPLDNETTEMQRRLQHHLPDRHRCERLVFKYGTK